MWIESRWVCRCQGISRCGDTHDDEVLYYRRTCGDTTHGICVSEKLAEDLGGQFILTKMQTAVPEISIDGLRKKTGTLEKSVTTNGAALVGSL